MALSRPRTLARQIALDTVVLGAAGAAAAILFNFLLDWSGKLFLGRVAGYSPPGLPSEGGVPIETIGPYGLWLIPIVTMVGGLIVGLITTRFAPEAEGHGTDSVVRAFHRYGGSMRARVAPIKLLASAITIGSGGSAGREGPIAMIAAALGSWYADLTHRDERDRRLLLLVGAAAGISAIFRSPIGASLFVVEVLYADMEFEAGVLLSATLAAIIAYALAGLVNGFGPLFAVPLPIRPLESKLAYGWYAILGLASGLLATALPMVFYRVRDLFRALRVPPAVKPAIGGFLTGVMAMFLPQLIGGGYGWMQRAIDGELVFSVLLMLALGKIVAMSLTVGSGGSGGVFAPSLYVGAMLGGAAAAAGGLPSAPFVIVGMAAVFAGSAHVPFAAMMMVVEMTGGYALLVPAALAVSLSYLVQTRLSAAVKYRSLYEAQVRNRAESPAHHTAHLEIALQILRDKQVPDLSHLGELDLVSLLRSGVEVDLAEGQRLMVGVLRADSAYANTSIGASGRALAGGGTNIIALLRGEHMVAPRADTILEPGDRLILVASDTGLEHLRKHFDPW